MVKLRLCVLFVALFTVQFLVVQGKSVTGVVVDDKTRTPLAGALVYLSSSLKSDVTDESGLFRIENLSSGKYKLIVSYLGYATFSKEVEVTEEDFHITVSLKEDTQLLSEIVVTGTGTEHYLKDAPVSTEVISGKVLRDFTGRDIEDVLSNLSSSFTYTGSDMGSSLQLNGLPNDYILVLLDGKRMSAGVGGQHDLSRINLQNIERIEIVKGAVSSLYGSDAIGGVINFISKKHKREISVSSYTRVGEHEDVTNTENVTLATDKFSSNTSFSTKHTHGWRNTTDEWHRNRLIHNSVTKTVNRSTNYSVSEQLAYDVNNHLQLSGDATFYQKWTKRPMGEPNYRLSDLFYQNQTYGVGAKYKFKQKHWISFTSNFDRFDYYYDYNSREYTDYFDENGKRIIYWPGDRILQSSERRFINNLKGVFFLSKGHTLSVGMEYIWEKLVAPLRLNNDKAHAYNFSIYAQDEYNITDKLNVTLGARFGKNRDFPNTFAPKVSAMYKVNDRLIFRATYSNGFKAPTMKELYYHYYATIMSKYKAYYGDSNLKAQKSNYYSLQTEYHHDWFKFSVAAYYNGLRDLISLQTTATSYEDKQLLVEETMTYVNLAKAHTYGVDFSSDFILPLNLKLTLGYSFLYARAQRTDDEEATDYMKWVNMNATSRHNANWKLSWFKNFTAYRLGVALTGRYQSKRYYTSHGDAKPFQIWRLNTSHGLLNSKTLKIDANVGVDNIFNFIDRTPFGHNRASTTPGRNYYVSLSMKWQSKRL